MGVFASSSILRKLLAWSGCGLRGNSEGRTGPAEVGVFKRGRLGLTVTAGDGITVGEARAMVIDRP